ncbi:hypothetical protein G5I_02420 [Acromyrmex echinatior]|uniref:Uncharacterized protein n=1 Tax=Acromyrmex echinatior TaxID=103372 RepID=F4WA91_ACREC|nr:hypothetical protein G5I_02420 [Acromyrmex echinatior]
MAKFAPSGAAQSSGRPRSRFDGYRWDTDRLRRISETKRNTRKIEELASLDFDIERLARLTYPECTPEIREKIACAHFISALSDGFVKRRILQLGVNALRTAIKKQSCHRPGKPGKYSTREEVVLQFKILTNVEVGKFFLEREFPFFLRSFLVVVQKNWIQRAGGMGDSGVLKSNPRMFDNMGIDAQCQFIQNDISGAAARAGLHAGDKIIKDQILFCPLLYIFCDPDVELSCYLFGDLPGGRELCGFCVSSPLG